MGATQSKSISAVRAKPIGSRELIAQFSIKLLTNPGFPWAKLQEVHVFCNTLLTKYASIDECRQALIYFNKLIARKDKYRLFSTAIAIVNNTEQIWFLNEQTLEFFTQLNEKNHPVFLELLAQLDALCKTNKLFLKANHLDTLIASLQRQIELPGDALGAIDRFLKESSIDYDKALQKLRKIHRPELDVLAKVHNKIHHAIPHSLEIRERTMHVLGHELGLFSGGSKVKNAFLKAIIDFMIEFHDHEQVVITPPLRSVEEVTAERIIQWFTEVLNLDRHPDLKILLEYIADRVVVLGTTMVFSPIRTVDLSELFLLIQNTAQRCNIIVVAPSNTALAEMMETTMLITGVCDKNPAAIHSVVLEQESDMELCTLKHLQHMHRSFFLERFFTTSAFMPYFGGSDKPSTLDIQAFFITLAPHLCMRMELFAKTKANDVGTFIAFIAECREQSLLPNTRDFLLWYDKQLMVRDINRIIDELLFAAIDNEASFSRSQIGGLAFVCKFLEARGVIAPAYTVKNPLIDCMVPARDAANLLVLNDFYKNLDAPEKTIFISELVLAVVMQAGFIYSQQKQRRLMVDSEVSKPLISGATHHLLFAPFNGMQFTADVFEEKILESSY